MSDKLLKHCIFGEINEIQVLLSDKRNPIDLNYVDANGNNALITAAREGRLNVVKYLLSITYSNQKINLYYTDKQKMNALMWAALPGRLEIVQYLLFEQNFQVDDNTMDWLIEKNHRHNNFLVDIIHAIKARDLHQKLDNTLHDNKNVKQRKI